MTRHDVVELFGVIKAIYQYQFNGDDLAVDVWHRLLADLDRELVFGALKEFAHEGGNFPPNCAQIIKRVNLLEGRSISLRVKAATSWREIILNRGRTADPVGAAALRIMGGWRRIGSMSESEVESWARRDFLELYDDLVEHESEIRSNNEIGAGANGKIPSANNSNDDQNQRSVEQRERNSRQLLDAFSQGIDHEL